MPEEPNEELLKNALEAAKTPDGPGMKPPLYPWIEVERARNAVEYSYIKREVYKMHCLIQAAPEMLAVLEEVLDVMVREDFGTLTLVPKIRAVIEKARG